MKLINKYQTPWGGGITVSNPLEPIIQQLSSTWNEIQPQRLIKKFNKWWQTPSINHRVEGVSTTSNLPIAPQREVRGKPTTFKMSPAQEAAAISTVAAPFSYATPYAFLLQAPDAISDITQFAAEPNFRNAISVILDIPGGLSKGMDDILNIGGMIDDLISTNE